MNEFDELELVFSEDELKTRIQELADEINRDYQGRDIVLICVLKGAVFFSADLVRKLDIVNNKIVLDFMKIKSYDGEHTNYKPEIEDDIKQNIKGKDVIILEDIIDTGLTLQFIIDELSKREPKSIKICTLLDKYKKRHKNIHINVDYLGFKIDNFFVLGYGFDLDEKYRTLPEVYKKKELKKEIKKPF